MKIVNGDLHDPLTATYQSLEVARLNRTLKECGLNDVKLRRRICEQYFFDSGYFLDSCWLAEEGRKFRPGIYFSEVDRGNREIGTTLLPEPSVGTMFHEYAHGAAAWLFDERNEDASEIQTGDVNAEV